MGTGLRTSSAFRTAEGESSPLNGGAETERPAASPPGAAGATPQHTLYSRQPAYWMRLTPSSVVAGGEQAARPGDRRGRVASPLGLRVARAAALPAGYTGGIGKVGVRAPRR